MADPAGGSGFGMKSMQRKNKRGLGLSLAPKPAAPSQDQNGEGSGGLGLGGNNRHSTTGDKLEIGNEFRLDLRAEDLIVIKELGAGNGGTVSKVQHVDTKVIMARKIIHVEAKKEIRKRIVKELQIMHECNSPYIVSFFGAFMNETGDVIMCMEYADVGSLDSISKLFGPIRVDVLGKIAESVLGGLSYLWQKHRIMHRDIKPSNILVNSKGQIKLCDFGVSSELEGSVAETFVGTGTYMAPERIQGASYTVKSDVWSVGLTLMELAVGKFPFHSDGADEHDGPQGILDLLQQIVLEPSPRLPQSDAFPQIMDDMLARCLLKNPAERPTPQELFEHDAFLQAAKRTPVDLQAWAVSMMERTNRRSHLDMGALSPAGPLTATPSLPRTATTMSSGSTAPTSHAINTPSTASMGVPTPTSGDVDLYMSNLSLEGRPPNPPTSNPQQYHQQQQHHQQQYTSAPAAPPPSAPLPQAPRPIPLSTQNIPTASSGIVMSATLAAPYSYDPYSPGSFDSPPRSEYRSPTPEKSIYAQQPPQYPSYSQQQPQQQSQQQQQAYDQGGAARPFPARTSSQTYGGPPGQQERGLGLGLQGVSNGRTTPQQDAWKRSNG